MAMDIDELGIKVRKLRDHYHQRDAQNEDDKRFKNKVLDKNNFNK